MGVLLQIRFFTNYNKTNKITQLKYYNFHLKITPVVELFS